MDFDKESQQRILRVAADKNEGRPIEEIDGQIAGVLDLHPEFDLNYGKRVKWHQFPERSTV